MSNSRFKKKAKTKNNDTKLELTNHLKSAIKANKLTIGKNMTGDWLALLSNDQLVELGNNIDNFLKDDDSLNDSLNVDDLLGIMMNLLMMETGRHLTKIKVPAIELFKRYQLLLFLCHFEKLSREGLIINVIASKKISGDTRRSYSYDLTPNGIIEACKEGASPILLVKLDEKDNYLGGLSEESQVILMRLAANYINLLENREWKNFQTMLDWIKQTHDPLASRAINMVNSYIAQELRLEYKSLTQAQRLSFLLDNSHYVKEFFSSEVFSSFANLAPKNGSFSQRLETLHSPENKQLINNYMEQLSSLFPSAASVTLEPS